MMDSTSESLHAIFEWAGGCSTYFLKRCAIEPRQSQHRKDSDDESETGKDDEVKEEDAESDDAGEAAEAAP